jgi:energy-coupling factor transporter ATP-binding protein EcfA2
MHINRIQIEEGFLSGLDLRLPSGLVAVIGARGTGKTSLIEAIRFCMGARNHTTEATTESIEHAKHTLDGGEITITLDDIIEDVVVARTADDEEPRATQPFQPPIIFSQKEIETIGLSESGRLSLIDGFVRERGKLRAEEAEKANSIKSLYREIANLESEIIRISTGLEELPALRSQIATLETRATEVSTTSAATAEKSARLEALSSNLTAIAVRADTLERFKLQLGEWSDLLDNYMDEDFGPEAWEGDAAADPLGTFRPGYEEALGHVKTASVKFKALATRVEAKRAATLTDRQKIEGEARTLRSEVDKLVEGAGAITRQLAATRSRIAQLEAVEKVIVERRGRLTALRRRRDELLNELEAVRDKRYRARVVVADKLNGALGPRIGVAVEKFGQYAEYTRALTEAFRGSGLKYNDLAAAIAEAVSPRELVRFVEEQAFSELAQAAGLPRDRAARALGVLQEIGLGEIVTCAIEDNVRLRLLDGVEYKDIATLSAGQRCTVILPIVLQHDERVLVIDQPEDHIDNAFITDSLIKAIRARSPHSQLIVSTHNANIPVLGDAKLIVQLTSDGRNGSVEVCKPLEDEAAVDAITSVMEGGIEAFRNRATFYDAHLL